MEPPCKCFIVHCSTVQCTDPPKCLPVSLFYIIECPDWFYIHKSVLSVNPAISFHLIKITVAAIVGMNLISNIAITLTPHTTADMNTGIYNLRLTLNGSPTTI